MRWNNLLVLLLLTHAGVLRAQTASSPSPAPSTPTAVPRSTNPASPSGVVQAGFATPAGAAATNPMNHPWYVKPEVGQWMIMVKAYSGPNSREMAEKLAEDLRTTYKVPAYLFEKGAEERQKERDRVNKEIEKQKQASQTAFLELTERMRKEALAKGMEFSESPLQIRVKTVRIEEQYAVLIGGWQTMDIARKQLDVIRTWPSPQDARLLDITTIVKPGADGKATGEKAVLNPFHTAFVTRNPLASTILANEAKIDPLVMKMNENEELSVLRIQKPWTIMVKSFFAPVNELKDNDTGRSIFQRVFNPKQDMLTATAQQARSLAETLRKLNPRPLEAYVLHTINGSLVCVGQYDASDDPKLLADQRVLEGLTFDIQKVKDGPVVEKKKMFDQLVAMRVKP